MEQDNLISHNDSILNGSYWDVTIIGAGPAGAVAARCLAEAGRTVLLLEKATFPRYKVCGGCLNGRAISLLQQAGLECIVNGLGGPLLAHFSIHTGKREVNLDLPAGMALSRATLDAALARAAVETGATFLEATHAVVGNRNTTGISVTLHRQRKLKTVTTKYVLAAGGLGFRPRGKKHTIVEPCARIGAGALFASSSAHFKPGIIYMALSRYGYVGLVRVEAGQLNVAAAFDAPFVRRHGMLTHAAAEVLTSCVLPIPDGIMNAVWRGTPPLMQKPVDVAEERILLIGDAAGYIEPFTGEGMAWAFESGYEAAQVILESVASPQIVAKLWRERHRHLFRQSQRRCRIVAHGLRFPALVNAATLVLCQYPDVAQPILRRLNEPASIQRNT